MPTTWLVGCGNMGRAMLDGWLDSGVDAGSIVVIDPALPQIGGGVRVYASVPGDLNRPETVVLAIKPQQLRDVVVSLAGVIGADTLLLSILAGVEEATLTERLGAAAVVRAMPNMPAAIGQGITVLHALGANAAQMRKTEALVAPLGAVVWLDSESEFDAVTALSGSGPAFLFRFIDALTEAGIALGLRPELAARLAMATVAGSGALALQSSDSPGRLAERVASPGGTTRAGLDVLDAGDALGKLVRSTLEAAARRSAELAAAARQRD